MFGRPAHTWSFDGEKIGTYVNYDLMVEEYTTSVSGKELYDVVGKTAFDKYDFSAYVDGKDDDFYKQISKNNKDDVDVTDNGALTQVFVDADSEEVVVTVINTYLAKLMLTTTKRRMRPTSSSMLIARSVCLFPERTLLSLMWLRASSIW